MLPRPAAMLAKFKSGFLAMLTPLVQGTADVAKDSVKKAAEVAPVVAAAAPSFDPVLGIGGPIAIALIGKALEKLGEKAQDHFDPASLHRLSFETLSELLKRLQEETKTSYPDGQEHLELWQELAETAVRHPAWAHLLAATELPAQVLSDWYLTGSNAEAHWPAMRHVLDCWAVAARWLRRNPSAEPPVVPFECHSLELSENFKAHLRTELPSRWTNALREAITKNANQQHFRKLQLEIDTAVKAKLDRLHAHATAPPTLTTVAQLQRRLGNRLIDLLRPQHPEAIKLTGRDTDLESLTTWAHSPNPVSIRTIIGRGGVGKTRIAIELLKRFPNWQAGFVSAEAFESFFQLRGFGEWEWTRSTLFVIDYASTQTRHIERLVKDLRDRDASDMPPLRILLLDRVAEENSGWYAAFNNSRIEGAEHLFHPYTPQALSILGPSFDRRQILKLAAESCSKFESKPAPSLPSPGVNPAIDTAIASEKFADPLVLTMAGFCAVEKGNWSPVTLSRTDLADEIAKHEMRRIRAASTSQYPERLLLSLACYVTILGGITTNETRDLFAGEAKALGFPNIEPSPLQELMLNSVTPGEARPIEPDLIGEAFVLIHALAMQGDDERMVVRATKHNPARVTQFVIHAAQDYGESEGLKPYQWISAVLDHAAAIDPALLYQLEAAIPKICPFAARKIALAISTRMLKLLSQPATPVDAFAPEYARLLNNLANRQSAVGQREAALATAAEAVAIRRDLTAANRDAFLPDLAMSLNNLATIQRSVGQREAALSTAAQAVAHYRELTAANRDAFLPDLAASLNNLATMQSDVGHREAALTTAAEAVAHYRELTAANRDAFLPDLAMSLNNLANMQSAVGQRETALTTAAEAVAHYRELTAANREAFLPDLAMSLNNLANLQSDVGQREAALATAAQAVAIRRELTAANRDAFLPNLAVALNTLATMQSAVGQREAALATAAEAVARYRELTAANREAFLPDLAGSLSNLANRQSDVGQRDAALATAAEAVAHYRDLTAANREAFLPDLAMSLNNLANTQSDVGQRDAALATAAEAVTHYRDLTAANRKAFLPNLARSLNNLANTQSNVGQREAALATAAEAVAIHRELTAANREAFLPDLAMSLNSLANTQSAIGQREAALATAAEAVAHYRELTAANRDAFLPDLAISLGALSQVHAGRDEHDQARVCLTEALGLLLPMAELHPSHHAQLLIQLAQAYISACQTSGAPPDEPVLARVVAVYESLK